MFLWLGIPVLLVLVALALCRALFRTETVPPNFVKAWRFYTLFGVMQGYLHPGRRLVLKGAEVSKPLSKQGRRLPFVLDVYAAGNEKFTLTVRVWFKRDLSTDAIVRNRARWDDPESVLHDLMSDLRKIQNVAFRYSARQMQSPVVLEQISQVLSRQVREPLFKRGFEPKPEGDDITIEAVKPDEGTLRAWDESARLDERVSRYGELLRLMGGDPVEASRAMQTILSPELGANHTTVNFSGGMPSTWLTSGQSNPNRQVAGKATIVVPRPNTKPATTVAAAGPTLPHGSRVPPAVRLAQPLHPQPRSGSANTQTRKLHAWVGPTLWGATAGVAVLVLVLSVELLVGGEFSVFGWIFGVGLGVVVGAFVGLIVQNLCSNTKPSTKPSGIGPSRSGCVPESRTPRP